MRILSFLAGIIAAALFPCALCNAQSFTGSISGTVTDPGGSVITGAKVTITRTETNLNVTGNLSPRVADIRGDHVNNFDLSLFKEFHPVREWVTLQFRAEALNAFNRVQFANPNTTVTSSSFGRVTAAANTPRQVQFGLKLLW